MHSTSGNQLLYKTKKRVTTPKEYTKKELLFIKFAYTQIKESINYQRKHPIHFNPGWHPTLSKVPPSRFDGGTLEKYERGDLHKSWRSF